MLACPLLDDVTLEVTDSDVQEWAMLLNDYVVWPLENRAQPLRRLELVTRDQVDLRTLWSAPWAAPQHTPLMPTSPPSYRMRQCWWISPCPSGQQTRSLLQDAAGTTSVQSHSLSNGCQKLFPV